MQLLKLQELEKLDRIFSSGEEVKKLSENTAESTNNVKFITNIQKRH